MYTCPAANATALPIYLPILLAGSRRCSGRSCRAPIQPRGHTTAPRSSLLSVRLGTWSGWVGKDEKPAKAYVPTESQRDEEKRKGKRGKVRMSLTLLRTPHYALADRRSIAIPYPCCQRAALRRATPCRGGAGAMRRKPSQIRAQLCFMAFFVTSMLIIPANARLEQQPKPVQNPYHRTGGACVDRYHVGTLH